MHSLQSCKVGVYYYPYIADRGTEASSVPAHLLMCWGILGHMPVKSYVADLISCLGIEKRLEQHTAWTFGGWPWCSVGATWWWSRPWHKEFHFRFKVPVSIVIGSSWFCPFLSIGRLVWPSIASPRKPSEVVCYPGVSGLILRVWWWSPNLGTRKIPAWCWISYCRCRTAPL